MYTFLKNHSAKISFKAMLTGLVVLLVLSTCAFIFIPENENTETQNQLLDIRIPLKYTQPLVIAAFNNVLRIKPVNAKSSKKIVETRHVASLPDGAQEVIKYIDAYPSTDVEQIKYPNKLKESLILKGSNHPTRFEYKINVDEYKWEIDEKGNLVFYDKADKGKRGLDRVFTIPEPYMFEQSQGEEGERGKVEVRIDGDRLVLIPDKEWIESHHYPIVVDPTIEIHVLNVYSYARRGENWEVLFKTQGQADLKIIPDDQKTMNENEFVSLSCLPLNASGPGNVGEERAAQVLEDGIIYYPNWECDGAGKVIYYTKKAGKYSLRFEYGSPESEAGMQTDYAFNQPGLEILVKVGSKYPDLNDPRHYTDLRDGQIIDMRPSGYYTGDMTRRHHCVIEISNIDYWELRGDNNWKSTKESVLNLEKYLAVADENGKYVWDKGYINPDLAKPEFDQGGNIIEPQPRRKRDWLIDITWLLQNGYINQEQYDSIYDKSRQHLPIKLELDNLSEIIFHEDEHQRVSSAKDQSTGTVASGTYSICASGCNYTDVKDFADDIAAQLTGNLTAEHKDEESAISDVTILNTDTNGHKLTLTAESGAEHNGGAYGNGARVNYGTYDNIQIDESSAGTLNNVEISNLAIDATGSSNYGIFFDDAGCSTLCLADANLIKTDSNTLGGMYMRFNIDGNARFTNNIVYGGAGNAGIYIDGEYTGTGDDWEFYNNTVVKCVRGIYLIKGTANQTLTAKNNLLQGNTTADWADDSGGDWDTTAKNVSEDSSSPDDAYDDLNAHDATSNFTDYDNNDYRLDCSGSELTTLDDGDDLSGTFTDDIVGTTRSTWYIGAHELTGCNSTPSVTSVTDTPDPTNPYRSVTFTIDWNDGDAGDLVKVKICKSANLTSQVCDDGHWASSTSFATTDPISFTYDIVVADHGQTRNYSAYACDDEAACSSASSGTFTVNASSTLPNIKVRGGATIR